MTTPEKKFFNKITDVSNVPFAMAVLNDKGEITEYGPYQVEFAHEIPHIPLYTTPQIKELSDKEISLVIWESYQSIGNATLTDLCKAILKKASKK